MVKKTTTKTFIKFDFSKKSLHEQLVAISLLILLSYQVKPTIQNSFKLDLLLKVIIFGSIFYSSLSGKKYIALIQTLILGFIFVQQTQIKKEIVMKVKEQVKKAVQKAPSASDEQTKEVVEKYGKYDLTLWDEENKKDLSDNSFKRRLTEQKSVEEFSPLEKQPTLTDLQYMENQLQKGLVTNLTNKEELENIEAKMITAEGLQRLQSNKFSDSSNIYHAPEFLKFANNMNIPGVCSTQASCHKIE